MLYRAYFGIAFLQGCSPRSIGNQVAISLDNRLSGQVNALKLKTKAGIGEILNNLVPATKNGLSITPKAMVAEGDKVAVEAESYGEFPNGRVYNNEYHFLVVVRDGKISAVKEYLDTMHTAEIIG